MKGVLICQLLQTSLGGGRIKDELKHFPRRNLVANSAEANATRGNTERNYVSPIPVFKNTEFGIQEIHKGGVFTLSMDYEINNVESEQNISFSLKVTEAGYNDIYPTGTYKKLHLNIGNNTGRYEFSFEPSDGQKQYGEAWLVGEFTIGDNANVTIKLTNIKLERGDFSTDWAPAPEDIETRLSALEAKVNTP